MRPTTFFALFVSLLLSACGIAPDISTVKISEKPAEGLTESSFDEGFLEQLAEETRMGAEKRLQDAYERNKTPPNARTSHARTQGRYAWLGDRQLAVIDLSYSGNPMRVMRVVGIEGDRLISISCISPQGRPLELDGQNGECAEAIGEHFPHD